MRAFIGLDGFVDDIVHVVDKRESAERYTRLARMEQWAERIRAAAGKSTNIELVSQRTKLGGNGPIMANAMATFGLQVTYLGNLGYPNLHPVFAEFARRARVHSLAEPGYTDAVEFEDGKVMLGKHQSLKDVTWANLQARFGLDRYTAALTESDFVAFVNWTMLPYMNEIWSATLEQICPQVAAAGSKRPGGARRWLFFDLADPEKRTAADIRRALELILAFEQYFDVILGLNEKESTEIGRVLGLPVEDRSPEGLARLGSEIRRRVPVNTVVIHPTAYALAVNAHEARLVEGPFTPKPLITTGAGDHFNAGFCLGKLLGLDNALSLLAGVSTSGFYVRTGRSPTLSELAQMLEHWPGDATEGG